jgi:hypothetical protein
MDEVCRSLNAVPWSFPDFIVSRLDTITMDVILDISYSPLSAHHQFAETVKQAIEGYLSASVLNKLRTRILFQ